MRNLLFLLLVIVLLGPLGIDLYLPAIPAIAKGLGSSESLIQSTISLFILILGTGQLISGYLADKFGRRPMAMAGMVLYIAGSLIAAFAVTPAMFIASRLIQGAGVCCTSVVAFTCVRDCFNGNEAARAFGFLNGTLNIVPALAPLLGGIMAEYYGWRVPFGFLALYAFILLIMTAKYLPETRPEGSLQHKVNPLKSLASVLFNKRFLIFSLVNAGTMGMVLTYVSLAPAVLMGDAALSPLQFSVVFGANGFWIMGISMIANRVIRKAGRPVCLVSGGVLMALGCAALALSTVLFSAQIQSHWLIYMLPVAAACAGLAFIMGPATSYALEPYSDNAGVASSLVGFMQMAGGAVLTLVAIASPLPPKTALAVTMLCGALLAWNAYRVSKKEQRQA